MPQATKKNKTKLTMQKNKAKRNIAAMAVAMMAIEATAQIPTGYYDALKGKSGPELKTAVHEVIKDADVPGYGSGKGKTWEAFYSTDRTDDNRVIDRYSNDVRHFGQPGSSVSGMNIEHSFPKSWWGGSENQAYKDLYNLMPCEQKINSSKSNYPMGEVTDATTDNGCTKVGAGSRGYKLWEPADRWKGDFARSYMYMATAYQDFTWKGTQALQILEQGDYPTLQQWAYELYISWAKADSPDQTETKRNEAVSQIQGNRNPFVDFPNLMDYIWGDSTSFAFDPSTTLCTSAYTPGSGEPEPPTEGETIYQALFTSGDGGCTATNDALPYEGFEVWTLDTKYGWKGTGFANYESHAADATLLTPEIDLSDCTEATLTFSHAANFFADPADVLSVEAICDGNREALEGIEWPAGTNWTFVESGEVSLSQYAGKKIRIAFHYTSTDTEAGTWEIRRMTVTGKKDASAIYNTTNSPTGFDPSQPYDIYTTDGRKAETKPRQGIVIIRQGGKTWKRVAGSDR